MGMIIEKQFAAKTSSFHFPQGDLPQTVHVAGLLDGVKTIAVNVLDESGAALPLYDDFDTAVTITPTSRPIEVNSPITLQFVKGVTANAVGVQVVR